MNRIAIVYFMLSIGIFSGCSQGTVVDYFGEVNPEGWSYDDSLKCEFQIEDTTHYYKLWTNLKITGDFTRSHMQLMLRIVAPDSSSKSYPVRIQVADKTGKWLGSGLGDVITYQQPVLDLQNFKQSGTYTVYIKQNFREDNWPNIQAAGIKITKDKEIF